ncbi:hypothetical protein [Roseovarius sp.]|uniref:hypothetical protein n=1 Tax=Roseovarius sp. TaxID=1486281 RepID=UPI003569AF3E
MTAFFIGLLSGVILVVYARAIDLTREAGFFPTLLGAIASFYVVFAIEDGASVAVLALHIGLFLVFIALATAGYRIWYWFTGLGLVLHAGVDLLLHYVPDDPSPDWWGLFCLSLDLVLAGSMLWLRPSSHRSQRER